jgi:NADH-quinone oxidoreductase subunit H
MFYLGEYVSTVTVAAVAVTLFLGGWQGYWPFDGALAWVGPVLWFVVKVTAVIYVLILVRATLPRVRYDRLMSFGCKVLIPFGLLWVLATGLIVILPQELDLQRRSILVIGAIVVVIVSIIWLVGPLLDRGSREEVRL